MGSSDPCRPATDSTIVRAVRVDRLLELEFVLKEKDRNAYISGNVLNLIPKDLARDQAGEVEIHLFRVHSQLTHAYLLREYLERRLSPAHPLTLATVNNAYPSLAKSHANCTHWVGIDGEIYVAVFALWGNKQGVRICKSDSVWFSHWYFAGVPNDTREESF